MIARSQRAGVTIGPFTLTLSSLRGRGHKNGGVCPDRKGLVQIKAAPNWKQLFLAVSIWTVGTWIHPPMVAGPVTKVESVWIGGIWPALDGVAGICYSLSESGRN